MNINQFLSNQLNVWPEAAKNYSDLQHTGKREFDFGNYRILLQHNPGRTRSTQADLSKQAIATRQCFLCSANRPQEQCAHTFGSYEVLVNPYPIFDVHLTIASLLHEPQRIENHAGTMMSLSKQLSDMAVFFNGAACGASAPDHLHFQAVEAHTLPLLGEFDKSQKVFVHRGHNYTVCASRGLGRLVYRIICQDVTVADHAVSRLLTELSITCSMCNIITFARHDGNCEIYIIPRRNFRPRQFYASDKRLIISPATIEMAGVFITPSKETFETITRGDVADILTQVGYSDSEIILY